MKMQDEQQYQQLLMQYQQLKNGAEDISAMIDREDFDSAIGMVKHREQLFLSCKCIRKYLDLTPTQQKEVDKIVEEIQVLELNNIKKLEKNREEVLAELTKTQKSQKIQNAYSSGYSSGSMVNIQK